MNSEKLQRSMHICPEYNVEYDGDDLAGYNALELSGRDECFGLCDATPLCKGSTYHHSGHHIHKCFLKDTEIVNRIHNPSAVSALKFCYKGKHFSEFYTTF